MAPLIPNLGARWRWVRNFTPRPLYCRKRNLLPVPPPHPRALNTGLGGPYNRSGRLREKFLAFVGIRNLDLPARSLAPRPIPNPASFLKFKFLLKSFLQIILVFFFIFTSTIYDYFHQLEWLSQSTNRNILRRDSAPRMRLEFWGVLAWTDVFNEYLASIFRVERRQEAPLNVGKFRIDGVTFQKTTFLTVITVIAAKFTQFFFALYFSFTVVL